MPSTAVIIATTVAAGYVFLRVLIYLTQDSREPPAVVGKIPFISPAFGMATEKANYYLRMRDEHQLPIYTLRAPGPRLYVVNSLQLIQRIDRHIDSIAFTPIEMRAADKAMGVCPAGLDKMSGDHLFSPDGYMMGFIKAVAPATMPGRGLDALQRQSAKTLADIMDDTAANGPTTVDLFSFMQHGIFLATTDATYGPHNPLRVPGNEENWYAYEQGIMPMLIGLPSLFIKKSIQAREKIAASMDAYLRRNKESDQGSLFLKLRQDHNSKFGLTLEDSVRTEIGQVLAAISNTTASAFWGIWQILADPAVFDDCQRECVALVDTDSKGNHSIDLSRVRGECPILIATWQEIMRFHGISIQARVIQKDTVINDEYLLKKGAMLMMPTGVLHSDVATWGPTAKRFDHTRFLKTTKSDNVKADKKRVPLSAFRGFGGGHVICPGRHFASGEILSFIVLLLVRFDITPVQGHWKEPRKDYVMNASFPNPLDPVEVKLVPKDTGRWKVSFSDSDVKVNVVAEDEE